MIVGLVGCVVGVLWLVGGLSRLLLSGWRLVGRSSLFL